MANPTSQKQKMAMPVCASTLALTCAAFLARTEPASSRRKPDCMKKMMAKQTPHQMTATTVESLENCSCETGGAIASSAAGSVGQIVMLSIPATPRVPTQNVLRRGEASLRARRWRMAPEKYRLENVGRFLLQSFE